MVGIYPRIDNEDQTNNSHLVWFGDEDERRMCEYCKTSKLNRNGRYYVCPTCNQRFSMTDFPEEVRVDTNVSKLDIRPALVFKDKTSEKEISGLTREELKKKYKIIEEVDDDLNSLRRSGFTIKQDYEH